jgi:hypothetical protein
MTRVILAVVLVALLGCASPCGAAPSAWQLAAQKVNLAICNAVSLFPCNAPTPAQRVAQCGQGDPGESPQSVAPSTAPSCAPDLGDDDCVLCLKRRCCAEVQAEGGDPEAGADMVVSCGVEWCASSSACGGGS